MSIWDVREWIEDSIPWWVMFLPLVVIPIAWWANKHNA